MALIPYRASCNAPLQLFARHCAAVLLLLFWGERVKNKRTSFTKNMPVGVEYFQLLTFTCD
jgi:hypothetical protein